MKKYVLVLGLLGATAFPAAANNVYLYADSGRSSVAKIEDQSEQTLAMGLGYTLTSHINIELGYQDLGKLTTSEFTYYPGVHGAAGFFDAHAIQLSAIAILPITEIFALRARLGYSQIKGDSVFFSYDKLTQERLATTNSTSENKAIYGIGADLKINEKISLRADYIKFDSTDIASKTIGVAYQF